MVTVNVNDFYVFKTTQTAATVGLAVSGRLGPKTKTPRTPVRVAGRPSNSPPPKSAQLQVYVLTCTVGMARTGYCGNGGAVRKRHQAVAPVTVWLGTRPRASIRNVSTVCEAFVTDRAERHRGVALLS
jgi:nicotinamide mononucleotide (NMN) deamidase PncC